MKKIGKQILAAISAIFVGTSCIQLPVPGVQLLHAYGADQEAEGLEFSVSGGEATVTGCTSTSSMIVIPSEYRGYPVTAIGENAFYDCDTLVSVIIPQGVTTLENCAFGYCDNLTTIYMPVSVTRCDIDASSYCESLSDVYYGGTSDQWDAISLCAGNADLMFSTIHYNSVLPQVEISSGLVYSISGGEVTIIGCTSTASEIVIPSEYDGCPVKAIRENAFYDCDTLVSVTIPQGVTTLGDNVFGYCDNLTTIFMPVSVTQLGDDVCNYCVSLADVYYEGTSNQWNTLLYGYLGRLRGATIHYNYVYPKSETSRDLLYSISGGEATVIGCTSTASEIVIPPEYEGCPVTAIGEKAFYGCDTLVSVTIPDGVTTLGDYAFGCCHYLTTIYMPVSVTSWGCGVSYNCSRLSRVYYGGTPDQWDAILSGVDNGLLWSSQIYYNVRTETEISSGLVYRISDGEATVIGCSSTASEIVIPSEYEGYPVTAIGEKAFYDCDTLVSVTIPQGVTTLGDYAFGYCGNLTTIYMPVSVTQWGYGVSYDCESLSDVYYGGTSDQWDAISADGGNGYLMNIATVHYEEASVTTIETTVEVTTETTAITEVTDYEVIESDGLVFSISSGGKATVIGCNSTASEIVIPSECEAYPVTAIGEKAFYECDTLVSVTIPQGVTTLEDYAFGYCGNLKTIYMPVSVTHWGYGVSYDCESLSDVYYEGTSDEWNSIEEENGNGYLLWGSTTHYNYVYPQIEISSGLKYSISGGEATVIGCTSTLYEVVIPSEYKGYPVTAIGEKAFYECDTLVSVTIPQGVTTLGDYAFGYCGNLTTIYMPVSVTHWGYGVSYDCESLSDVYYGGTSDQWDAISSDGGNGYLRNIATIHYQESVTTGTTAVTTMTETTTTETTTTMAVTTETASTDVHEPCEWALEQIRVQPGDGMDEDLNFSVYIDQPISSYGLQGAIYLPDATAELLYWPYMESSALMGEIYSGARLTTNMNELLNNQGNCIYFAMDSSEVMNPSYTSGVLLQLTFAVPDDLAVAAVAEKYGLQLQRDADGYYYEFPVCWMEEGYDGAVSNGQTVMLPRYSYIDSKNQDVFSDDVVLTDGYIRVDMPLYDVTSDTYPETTTTTVTTTTTASSTFPTTDQTTTTRTETMPVTTSFTTELRTTIRTETEYWETEQTTSTTTARSTTMTTPSTTTTSWRTSVSLTSATTNTTTWWTTTSYPSTDLTDIATFTTRMTTDTTATSTYTSTWMSTSITTETSIYTQPTVYVMANTVVLSLAELQKNNYQVEVPVTLIDNPGFSQLAFGASWDTAYLTLKKCRGDADMLAFTPDVNKTYGDFAWLPFLSTNFDVNGNMLCYTGSSLCTLTFTVSEDAQPGDIYPIVLNYESPSGEMASAMSEESLELMLVRGEIIITEEESTGTSTETTSATTASTNTTATTTGGTDTSSYTTTGDVETTTESVYTSASTTTETTVTTTSSESEEGFYVELGKPSADQLYVGNAFRLLYSTNATNLIWKSTDESIATVNNSGMLTILDSGTVSIIVIVQEDPTKTDTITITIPEAGQTTNTTGDTTGGTGSSTTTTTTTTDAETAVLRGDADMDGGVDPDDAYLALVYYARRSVGDLSFTFQKDAALEPLVVQQVDVDRNGVITPDDAYLILCYYAKLSVGMTDIRWEDLM